MSKHRTLPDPVDGVFPTDPVEGVLMLAVGIMLTGNVDTPVMETIAKSKGLAALHNNYVTACDWKNIDRDERRARLRTAMGRVADVIQGAIRAEVNRRIHTQETLDRIKP